MGLFHHRPLFLWCASFTGAAALGYLLFAVWAPSKALFSDLTVFLIPVLLLLLGGGIAGGFLLFRAIKAGQRIRSAVTVSLAFWVAVVGLSLSYHTFLGKSARYFDDLAGERVTVSGVVIDCRGTGDSFSSFTLELEMVEQESVEARALLSCHYATDLLPGERIFMTVQALSLEEAVGDGYSADLLRGDGISVGFLSEDESEITIIGRDMNRWEVVAGKIRREAAARLNILVGDAASGIPSALLLGERSALSDQTRRDFARAGVSHLLAISGLHMALLFGTWEILLRLLRVPRRWRAVLLGVSAFGYLCLLGFPPSATRAVIMLGMVYLSVLLSARADPLTSLGVAGCVILFCTPYAAADAGFWMSYLSTLAPVAVMPQINAFVETAKRRSKSRPLLFRIKAVFLKVVVGLLVGIVAMSATLTVVAAVIGEMGVLSPVSTLLLTPLCGAVLLLSLFCLLLANTPAGPLLGRWIAFLCTLMTETTSALSEPKWSVISLVHPLVLPITVVMMVLLFGLLCMRLPRGRQWVMVIPLLTGWLAIGSIVAVSDLSVGDTPRISYIQPSSQSDLLLFVEGREAVICDFSNGSLSALTAAATEASARGATEVSVLMLTHYHRRTIGTLGEILAREMIRSVWIPLPKTDEERLFLSAYLEKAEAAGVSVLLYETGTELSVLDACSVQLQTTALSRSVQPVFLFSMTAGEETSLLYCGASVFESDLAATAVDAVPKSDIVLFGNHGPLPKQPFGDSLSYAEDAQIVLSGEGDVAELFDVRGVTSQHTVWIGQWRYSKQENHR